MEVAAQTLVSEAREMMGLVGTPTGFITGTLLATSNAAIRRNQARLDRGNTMLAVATSGMALAMAAVLVAVMSSIAARSATGDGGIEGVLVLYWLAYLTAIGVAAYSAHVVRKALNEVRRLRKADSR